MAEKILETLVRNGARHAEPGEFTKRAFLNGKIDLTQAEGVLDLIRAGSDLALQAAADQLRGRLSEKIRQLKEDLMKIYAHFEGGLDFPDEHLEIYPEEEFRQRLGHVEEKIQNLISGFERGLALREGVLTVIAGRPNVGKSSLFNALLARDRALVSHLAGTTRDALEETVQIGGWRLRLVDTAGLAGTPRDEIEGMGMERSRQYLQRADLLFLVLDGSSRWTDEDETFISEIRGKEVLPVINKKDLSQQLDWKRLNPSLSRELPCFVSCLTGDGLAELEQRVKEWLLRKNPAVESLTLTRLRHKQALETSLEKLQAARRNFEEKVSSEFILEDLKSAIDSLRELVGEIYSEDLLDVIFSEFCIGK